MHPCLPCGAPASSSRWSTSRARGCHPSLLALISTSICQTGSRGSTAVQRPKGEPPLSHRGAEGSGDPGVARLLNWRTMPGAVFCCWPAESASRQSAAWPNASQSPAWTSTCTTPPGREIAWHSSIESRPRRSRPGCGSTSTMDRPITESTCPVCCMRHSRKRTCTSAARRDSWMQCWGRHGRAGWDGVPRSGVTQ